MENNNIIDFSKLNTVKPAVIDADVDNYIDRVFDNTFGNQYLKYFYKFFPGLSDTDKKIKIYLKSLIESKFEKNVSLIHWLEQSKYSNYTIISTLGISRVGKKFWELTKLKIFHLPIIDRQKLFIIKKTIIGLIKYAFFYKRIQSRPNPRKEKNRWINLNMFKVMFFPHKTVFYGDLYLKDHFYSKDKSSLFHPKNMIHLEYDNIDIEKTKARYKEYFGFEPYYMSLNSLIMIDKKTIYKKFLNKLDKELIIYFIKRKISLSTILRMASLYYAYLYYNDAIKEFKNVKIALVGYDVLFPISLSLALESNGIKTIAYQERFVLPFYNNYGYIVDTNFVASKYISSIIQQKKDNSIYATNIIPTGLLRSDKLFTPKIHTNGESDRNQILVFDYHVENQYNYQISQPLLNWKNDLFFRKEILKLATEFDDYNFIIRGKNNEWTKIPFFFDILDEWMNTPNITIDANYSEFYWSYELCNNSDLIIARHTLIVDECISKGFEVIIHDYGINYSYYMREIYPEIPGINFCHSYKELKNFVKFFDNNGYITDQELKNNIINTLFDGLCDGNVQSRITQYLQKIDYQELR